MYRYYQILYIYEFLYLEENQKILLQIKFYQVFFSFFLHYLKMHDY